MIRRLLLTYLSLTVLVLLGLEIPFALTYSRQQHQQAAVELERQATIVAELVDELMEKRDGDRVPEIIDRNASQTGTRILVVDARGELLAASFPLTGEDNPTTKIPELRAALRLERVTGSHYCEALDRNLDFAAVPSASEERLWGAVRLETNGARVDDAVHRMWLTLAVVAAGVLVTVTGVGLALAHWMTRPLRSLEHATAELADGGTGARANTRLGPPELRRLSAAFNRTAERLRQLISSQRSFAADASHQLRTPLTALRLRLENLEPDLSEGGRRNLDAALDEVDRFSGIIDTLLALARLDDEEIRPEPVDLDAIVATHVNTWSVAAAARGVTVTQDDNRAGPVRAIPGALGQILDALIANALRVAPKGSTITLARRPAGRPGGGPPAITLHVVDQGPGMDETQRRRAFDRFWRAPTAPSGGSGLGLAIVQRLVHASGGEVTLHQAPGGGLDVAIMLRRVYIPDGTRLAPVDLPALDPPAITLRAQRRGGRHSARWRRARWRRTHNPAVR